MADKVSANLFIKATQPYLGRCYEYAFWLLRNKQDAEDAVQEAYFKAFKNYHQLRTDNTRAWLLTIVRNCSMTVLRNRKNSKIVRLDTSANRDEFSLISIDADLEPDRLLERQQENDELARALENLPELLKEVLVLRELQQLSYREIALILDCPKGTVMSRLSRARSQLIKVHSDTKPEKNHEL